MVYIDGFGHLHDGAPPDYDQTNGQGFDPEPWLPPRRRIPLLRAKNTRYDVQYTLRGFWATAEGALVRISAMSDSHLLNAIKFMEKRARRRAVGELFRIGQYVQNAPEHAGDAADNAAQELAGHIHDPKVDLAKLADDVFPKYKELVKERERRGL